MRRAPARGSERGVALVEVALSSLLAIGALGSAISLARTTSELGRESHVETRVRAEHRAGLLAIGDVLRGATSDSLEGFTDGVATEPVFRRATGLTWHEQVLSDSERLEWRSSGLSVPGVTEPGAVWYVATAGDTLVADRVPSGGFTVLQEGNVLSIRLRTYYATDADHVAEMTSETAVSLRN
jgi:hypothetical protein